MAAEHRQAVFEHEIFRSNEQAAALLRIGEHVASEGMVGPGGYRAARALLLREPPPLKGTPVRLGGETTLDAALRLACLLGPGFLAIQGPPGTGKSHTAARMICELARLGRGVGITANSHKVIRNLLDKVVEASAEMAVDLTCVQKAKDIEGRPALTLLRQVERAPSRPSLEP